MSAGVATAAVQANLSDSEKQQLAAFAELKKTHEFLLTLPQNDAYRSFNNLTPEWQDALKSYFSPKYVQQDKGFFGNIGARISSSAHYAAQTFKEIGMQIAGLPVTPTTSLNPAEALLTLGTAAPVSTSKETGVSTGFGNVVNTLIRPQEKLVKQPYQATRLASEAGEGGWDNAARYFVEGAKELLPGGTDAAVTDNSQNWKKFWEQASDKENVFDASEVAKIKETTTPEVAMVAQLLAGKKNFIDYYDQLLANPKALNIVNRFTSGKPEDEEIRKLVGDAVARFEKAKISPGRDVARTLVSLFPFEAEKAMMGDGKSKLFFDTISGGIDFGVTFGLDPLILTGKAKRATDIARFSLVKMGENPANLEKAWGNASVRRYWDNLGQLFQSYNAGDLATKGAVLTRIEERFPEISLDVAKYMAPNIKDADTALEFFRGGDIIDDISKGSAGLRRDPLIPRYTIGRGIKDWTRDSVIKALPNSKYTTTILPDTVGDIAAIGDANIVGWAGTAGFQEARVGILAGRNEGKQFVAKDVSTAAKVDRFMRQFAKAPSQDRLISLTDSSSADQVYRLMRTVLDKGSASTLRAAWITANEGQRLLMYKGIVKTLAYGMGLDLTTGGKKFIDEIDSMSKELYSVNQSALDLGEFSKILGTARATGLEMPTGVRKLVQEATDKADAEGMAKRVAASTSGEIKALSERIAGLKAIKKQMVERLNIAETQAEKDLIVETIADIDKSLKIAGGQMGNTVKARKAIKNVIDGLDPLDIDYYNAAELNGAQRAVRAYQLSQSRYMPNLVDLRKFELRGNIFSSITGKVGESVHNQKITDVWSYLNLYPRLGIRSSVEEVGTYGLIAGAEGIGNYIKGYAMSQEIRKATAPSTKISAVREKEKEVSTLGIFSRTLYRVLNKTYTRQQIAEFADNPEVLSKAIGTAMLRDRLKPEFLQTAKGQRVASYAEDFVRNDGSQLINDINGAATKAEFKTDVAEETAKHLNQFGPSVTYNVDIAEALKDQKFAKVYSQIQYNRPGFMLNWYLDLHNTIGKKNIFGQIVFTNIGKKEEDVIDTLVKYLDGKGNDLAKKFAIYNSKGSYEFAKAIYADATYGLRDFSGRLNKELINDIKSAGGIDKFDFTSLKKYEEGFKKPKAVLGRELIPLQPGDTAGFFDRVIKNGYGWIGRQIALIDREPITYGNYLMYREDLIGYQKNIKRGLLDSGIDDASADLLARNQADAVAKSLARQRTIGYVDNADIRTNLAFNIRNFGRYYRATEDFYRRAGRIAKYEKRAIVRLAILNQTFEHSGFIHKDANGEMYFTYPGDDVLNFALGNTVFRLLGIPGAQVMPVNLGGKVKMLTPSLDPESSAPRLGGPFVGISLAMLENIPGLGGFLKSSENIVTGGNSDQEWWRKFTPINIQRLIDLGIKNDKNMMTEQKFSATVQAMRLLNSIGQGPKDGNELDPFLSKTVVQASNIMALRFVTGLGAPASVQLFATKDVPKEMINAGYFTWDSEFAKFVKKHANEENAFSKALVEFATLYPSKTVYSVSKTDSQTEAGFQKSYEAAQFVRDNKDLIDNHKQAASFFIPINGTGDLASYSYLKAQGFVKNKQLEDFLRQAATAESRQNYNVRRDYYDNLIMNSTSAGQKRYYRDAWKQEQTFFKSLNPLLAASLSPDPAYIAKKNEALRDLRFVVNNDLSPNKELGTLFKAMVMQYDNAQSLISSAQGSTNAAEGYRKQVKSDTKEFLRTLAGNNANAISLYWNLFEPLIGD